MHLEVACMMGNGVNIEQCPLVIPSKMAVCPILAFDQSDSADKSYEKIFGPILISTKILTLLLIFLVNIPG